MNYYFDTEFHEYFKQPGLFGIPVGKPIPTIDLISIGIVSEDYIGYCDPITIDAPIVKEKISRGYYAVNKECNLRDAWDSFQWSKKKVNDGIPGAYKEYWIRNNVLKSIYIELKAKELDEKGISYYEGCTSRDVHKTYNKALIGGGWEMIKDKYLFKELKRLIKKYGKTREQIAQEVLEFINPEYDISCSLEEYRKRHGKSFGKEYSEPKFYAYYADYDWVVFCQSLFGRMMDLPDGFPWYCIDLKQMFDEKECELNKDGEKHGIVWDLKDSEDYPKQENEHNALDDAKWNKKLHEFINSL